MIHNNSIFPSKLIQILNFKQRDSEASGLDEPCQQGARLRPGSECSARVLAEALSKIAPSNEADTQSILGNEGIYFDEIKM